MVGPHRRLGSAGGGVGPPTTIAVLSSDRNSSPRYIQIYIFSDELIFVAMSTEDEWERAEAALNAVSLVRTLLLVINCSDLFLINYPCRMNLTVQLLLIHRRSRIPEMNL